MTQLVRARESNAEKGQPTAAVGLGVSRIPATSYVVAGVESFSHSTVAYDNTDRGELTFNPVSKVDTFDLENERTRELSVAEEARLRAAIGELYPSKLPEFDLLLHNWRTFGQLVRPAPEGQNSNGATGLVGGQFRLEGGYVPTLEVGQGVSGAA